MSIGGIIILAVVIVSLIGCLVVGIMDNKKQH